VRARARDGGSNISSLHARGRDGGSKGEREEREGESKRNRDRGREGETVGCFDFGWVLFGNLLLARAFKLLLSVFRKRFRSFKAGAHAPDPLHQMCFVEPARIRR